MNEQALKDLAEDIHCNVVAVRETNKSVCAVIKDPAIKLLLSSLTSVLNNQERLANMLLLLGTPEE